MEEKKHVVIGIDTGGTYTDGVLVEYETKRILRGVKVFTTKEALIKGIRKCIDALHINQEHEEVCFVCLSTTLATNAIVEGKNKKVGLITIGEFCDEKYPTDICINVDGKMDIMGREMKPVDEGEIKRAASKLEGKVKSVVVSGFASVKNPKHEIQVKKIVENQLNIPVVCAHETSTMLGAYERTITSVINARLIPIIEELLTDTQCVLKTKGIDVPISIMKGDGYSIPSDYAKTCPVETVLSGPAASMMGGKFLTGLKNAIVVDMGGTTTDIVRLNNGEAVVEKNGMRIKEWKTQVKSVKVYTYGLGGDSRIKIDVEGRIRYGPTKAIPLCIAATEYPYLLDEMREVLQEESLFSTKYQAYESVFLCKNSLSDSLQDTGQEEQLIRLLEDGPHTLGYISRMLGIPLCEIEIRDLENAGTIQLISLTPTDILHVTGEYKVWNSDIVRIVIGFLAKKLKEDKVTLLKNITSGFIDKICYYIYKSVCEMEGINVPGEDDSMEAFFYEKVMSNTNDLLDLRFSLKNPIIGIGAPAAVWLKKAAERLKAEFILPEYSHLANAIGVTIGDVKEYLEAQVCYDKMFDKYVAYLPKERIICDSLIEAKKTAQKALLECAAELSRKLDLPDTKITIGENEYYVDNIYSREPDFIRASFNVSIAGNVIG